MIESFRTFRNHKTDKEFNSVLHFYHTTQKILVQGNGTSIIAEGIIGPHILNVISQREEEIF